MHILVDGMVFENNFQLGIQRYFRETLGRLSDLASIDLALCRQPLAATPSGCRELVVRTWLPGWSARQHVLTATLGKGAPSYDLFHSTFFSCPDRTNTTCLVTVYDMIVENFARDQGRFGRRQARQKRRAIKAADSFIAISKATADDLVRLYPETAGRIHVIHLGVNAPAVVETKTLDSPYAIFVGARGSYKNFEAVLRAMDCSMWPPDLRLVVAGQPFDQAEVDRIGRAAGLAARVTLLDSPGDSELWSWMKGARCLIFPSLCEGFGLPLVEAQSLGTPVVCSDIPVFRELANDTTLFFSPRDEKQLANAVAETMNDSTRLDLACAGTRNAERFTWESCAEKTLQLYRSLC